MVFIIIYIMSFVEEMVDEIVFLFDGKIYFWGFVVEIKMQYQVEGFEEVIVGILKGQLFVIVCIVVELKFVLQFIMSYL